MRNLQKILALVLALIMSFSLVATAGAFSDGGDISDAYKDAVTVLNGLEVFKGYDNGATFQPKGNITRAEVAAIIYRIATGDVKDTQASIYSTYGQFTDVLDGSWYAGYVNYCANAGYIKGRGNKIFDPQATVTGYEALAMILRAVGYDKNGEFTGSNWQIRTASIANERGISKNVTSAMLGRAATREVVAELLFRSIIIPKVNFNANTLSYTEKPLNADGKKDTLGYESLKLEEIEGVVTANEYADLEATEPLSANRTRLDVDGVDYTLEYKSDLDYLGESRIAYVQNLTGSKIVNNVLLLGDTGDNVVYDEGKKIDTKDAAAEKGIKLREDTTQYFVNYDPIDEYQADWRIEYVYTWTTNTYAAVERVRNNKGTLRNLDTNTTVNTDVDLNDLINLDRTQAYKFEYRKTIAVGEFLTPTDISLINTIFGTADYEGDYILGEVYVGTTSIKKTDDISDDISYREFVDTYLTLTDNKKVVEKNGRGNRLKLIDNNNDGVVEYVLQTKYTVTTVSKIDSDGKFVLENKNVPLDANDVVNEIDNDTKFVKEDGSADLTLNDVVLYAVIDGNARTEKAEMVNAKIDKVNRTNGEVTTTDGTTYEDSSICAHAEHYNDNPKEMAGSTNYNLYLDKYGYLAAFNEAEESFALLVDGWYNRVKGGDEYAVKTWQDGKLQTVDVSANGDLFIGGANSLNNDWDQIRTLDNATGSLNNANRTDVRNDVHTSVAMLSSDGVLTPVDMAYHTLKQSYIIDMKDNRLPDRDGERGQIYTTRANAIDRTAYNVAGVGADADVDVRALSSTVYYFVYNALSGNRTITQVVREYVGYQNLPNSDYANYIEDVYAVGTTQTSSVNNPYYTAEVVVVELNNDYYNTLGGEQVFIPRFPIAGTNVTLEEVKLVRENGAFEEVTIDLSRSDLRYYDIANGTETNANRNALAAGLYRMWRVSDSDTYYVRYMSAAEIDAADRYYVGMVDYNTGTGAHNYTVVDLYGRDVNDAHARATGQSASALNLDTTKYYTYKGDELTESDRNTVMIQTPTADIRRTDTCVDWRNETQTNGGYQRNEVLIAYDKADNGEERIAYAISFNEYDSWDSPNSHVHDAAQTVWDSCTPYHNFGGAPVDPDADKVAAAKLALNGLTFTAIVVPAAEADAEAYVKAAIAAEANDKQNSLVITAADVTIGDISGIGAAPVAVNVSIALKSGAVTDAAAGTADVSKEDAPAEYTLKVDGLEAGSYSVTINGNTAADGDVIHAGDTISVSPDSRFLNVTNVADGKVTGDVTISIVEGASWTAAWNLWTVTDANGSLIMLPFMPTAARMARSARESAVDWPEGEIKNPPANWVPLVLQDTGATYTIQVDNVVWTAVIGQSEGGATEWKLTSGTIEEAKAAAGKFFTATLTKVKAAGETPAPETGTVSVSVKKPLQSGHTMLIKSIKNGVDIWGESCLLPVENGLVKIEVDYNRGNDATVPVMLGVAKGAFTEKNGIYTMTIPAVDGDKIELGEATSPIEVKLVETGNVKILGASSNGEKAVKVSDSDSDNVNFDPAVFTVTVPENAVPRAVDLSVAGVAVSYKQVNSTTWEITLTASASVTGVTGKVTTLSSAPTVNVTVKDGSSDKVRLEDAATGTAADGTFTFKAYVLNGNEPALENLDGAKMSAKLLAGQASGSMELWEITLSEINSNINAQITGESYRLLEVQGCTDGNGVKLGDTGVKDHVRVSNGKASLTVYVAPDKRLESVEEHLKDSTNKAWLTNADWMKVSPVDSKRVGDQLWAGWLIELSNIPTTAKTFAVVTSTKGASVRIHAPVGTGITPQNQTAYMNIITVSGQKYNQIEFTVTAEKTVVPSVTKDELDKVFGTNTAGKPVNWDRKIELVDAAENQWKFTIYGKHNSKDWLNGADLDLTSFYMPRIGATVAGSGINPDTSTNPNPVLATLKKVGNDVYYAATFKFNRPDSRTRLALAATNPVTVGATSVADTNYNVSITEAADSYTVTAMVKYGDCSGSGGYGDKVGGVANTEVTPGSSPVDVNVKLQAVTGYQVSLKADPRFTVLGNNPQIVPAGQDANFSIKLKGEYFVKNTADYTASDPSTAGQIAITVPNVRADKEITLDLEDISSQEHRYFEATYAGNLVAREGTTFDKSGDLPNGVKTWYIGAETGATLVVEAQGMVSKKDRTDDFVTITRVERYQNDDGQNCELWKVVVEADENVHLDFKIVNTFKDSVSTVGAQGAQLGLDMQPYAGVGAMSSRADLTEVDQIALYNLSFSDTVKPIGDTISFYVLVADGCTVTDAYLADSSLGSVKAVEVSESEYGKTPDYGYYAVRVTVTLREPANFIGGGLDSIVYLGAAYNNPAVG